MASEKYKLPNTSLFIRIKTELIVEIIIISVIINLQKTEHYVGLLDTHGKIRPSKSLGNLLIVN